MKTETTMEDVMRAADVIAAYELEQQAHVVIKNMHLTEKERKTLPRVEAWGHAPFGEAASKPYLDLTLREFIDETEARNMMVFLFSGRVLFMRDEQAQAEDKSPQNGA